MPSSRAASGRARIADLDLRCRDGRARCRLRAALHERTATLPSLGGDPKAIAAISLADVRAFASRAFRSQNATLVVSGAVDASVATAAVSGRPNANESAEAPTAPVVAASPTPVNRTFVQASGGYGWVGPTISDQREATAMDFIADYLFRIDDGVVARSRGIRSGFVARGAIHHAARSRCDVRGLCGEKHGYDSIARRRWLRECPQTASGSRLCSGTRIVQISSVERSPNAGANRRQFWMVQC